MSSAAEKEMLSIIILALLRVEYLCGFNSFQAKLSLHRFPFLQC